MVRRPHKTREHENNDDGVAEPGAECGEKAVEDHRR